MSLTVNAGRRAKNAQERNDIEDVAGWKTTKSATVVLAMTYYFGGCWFLLSSTKAAEPTL